MKKKVRLGLAVSADLNDTSYHEAREQIIKHVVGTCSSHTGLDYWTLVVPSQLAGVALLNAHRWGATVDLSTTYDIDEWSLKTFYFDKTGGMTQYFEVEVHSPGA